MPVAAEQFAHRRPAHHRGELGARVRRLHRVGGAEIAIPLSDRHAWSSRRGPWMAGSFCCADPVENNSMTMSTIFLHRIRGEIGEVALPTVYDHLARPGFL